MANIERMQDFSEVVHYENPDIPLYIRTSNLSIYPDMSAPCHWHDDIEWIHIVKGCMCYYINGKHLMLYENDSIMVNARQMHYGYSYEKQDCHYLCILFHPSLFGNNQALLQKYITPIIKNDRLEYLYFDSNEEEGKKICEFLTQIIWLKEQSQDGYEMEVIALMQILWAKLLQSKKLLPPDISAEANVVVFSNIIYNSPPSVSSIPTD